jgi:hypothetical protein
MSAQTATLRNAVKVSQRKDQRRDMDENAQFLRGQRDFG